MMSTTQINMMKEQGLSAEEILAQLSGTTTETKNEKKNEIVPPTVPEAVEETKESEEPETTIVGESKFDFDPTKCMARRFYHGLGGQCTRKPTEGSDYCKLHTKKAEVCNEPAVNKKGLWLGRIDQERPTKNKDGVVVIEWAPEDQIEVIKERIKNKKSNTGKKEKKAKKPKTRKRAPSAYAFFLKMAQEQIKEATGDSTTFSDRQKKASEIWKNMDESEKAKYVEMSKEAKLNFKKEKVDKGPKKPKRPLSAYLCYAQEKRIEIKKENPELKMTEITKLLGTAWKAEEDKTKWKAMAAEKRKVYDAEMEVYKSQLPKEQPPPELFEEEEVAAAAPKSEEDELKEDEEDEDDEPVYYGFICTQEPYNGDTLALDVESKQLYKIVDDEPEFVGILEYFEVDESGAPIKDSFKNFNFDAVE